MPKISEFYGISIYLYSDHLPPHIHIYYKNIDYRYNLNTGEFLDKAPKTLRKLINIWYNEHKVKLLEAWELMQTKREVLLIEPLE